MAPCPSQYILFDKALSSKENIYSKSKNENSFSIQYFTNVEGSVVSWAGLMFLADISSLIPGGSKGEGSVPGLSKGVGFIRFDQRIEAERAIQKLNGTIPEGATEPITVKFANNPSNNAKAIPPLAAYLAPQAARRALGAALHPASRFR